MKDEKELDIKIKQVEKLKELLDLGIITSAEYDEKRKQLLDLCGSDNTATVFPNYAVPNQPAPLLSSSRAIINIPAGRLKQVFCNEEKLYQKGSPVIIESNALLIDSITRELYSKVQLRNISNKAIDFCKVLVYAYDSNGNMLPGTNEYEYSCLNCAENMITGDTEIKNVLDNRTAIISACVTEVKYQDGEVWKTDSLKWDPIPKRKTLSDIYGDIETIRQFKIENGYECIFYPEISNGLFYCSCGRINPDNAVVCYKCGLNKLDLIASSDEKVLNAKKEERIKQEKEQAEKDAALTEIRNIKIIKASIIAVIITLLVIFVCEFVIPAINYQSALTLIENGKYEEAIETLEKLEDYKDSEELLISSKYSFGKKLLEDGNYNDAYYMFDDCGNYKQSKALKKKSAYKYALKHMNKAEYQTAIKWFRRASGYKDSKSMILDAKYKYVISHNRRQDETTYI